MHSKNLQKFKACPKLKWTSYTLLNNGAAHVVQIGAANPEDKEWKTYDKNIQPILKRVYAPIGVKVDKGNLNRLNGDDATDHEMHFHLYALGRSCNVKDVQKDKNA